ncbi:Pentatricopeptide repeat [Macleaya cordata]|uniref:Pentatricopeptide repeat n=1 Tax=Macleaya cordata TaxID=56857 RepID=A0A200RDQ6_MACCD|nr:Pentatricopeptide repeat [Macleaya cordata]
MGYWSRIEEDRIIRLIKLCKDVKQLKRIQGYLVMNGQSQNNFLITKLVREFTAFGDLKHARNITESVDKPNVYLWTAMIRGYSQRSGLESEFCCREALLIYTRMHRSIDKAMAEDLAFKFTLSSVLKACAGLMALQEGFQVHAHVAKYGYQTDIRIQTSLIDFYAKFGLMKEAQRVFDKMTEKDVQAWNTMITGHTKSRNMEAAISLFRRMPERNMFTWEAMITGYADMGLMDKAQELFDELLEGEMKMNAVIHTAMIMGYAKCSKISDARLIFDRMVERDTPSWNAMIAAYNQAGLFDESLDLFRLMIKIQEGNVKPNQTTIAMVVSACAQLGSIELAQWIRNYIDSRRNELMNNHTVTALIDMHAKCGEPGEAYEVFKRWKNKDMVCYSTMMAAFGMHGNGAEVLKIFSQLQEDGLKPDEICFIVVLSACSHAGLVEEGCKYFESMQKEYKIAPTADHYMCMVDLLGRAGRVADAYKTIIEVMPPVKPHAGIWGALLSACRIYNNVEIGEVAGWNLLEMEPENAGNYVLLSNIYAKEQRWGEVAKVRALMRNRVMKKPPGCSWIEIGGKTQKFLTGNVQTHLLEMMMQVLAGDLKAQGYNPGTDHED